MTEDRRPPLVEICVETTDHAIAAEAGGAGRIELCSALTEGGVTPSMGLFSQVRQRLSIPIFVLIRPRRGDFLYTEYEKAALLDDLERFRDAGAHGIVTGALTPDGEVDESFLATVMDRAGSLPVTFHRAFDHVRDPESSLETLIACGATRVLTSGGRASVREGLEGVRARVEQSAGRIGILPGGGVRPAHVDEILRESGASEIHASASSWGRSAASFQNPHGDLAGTAPSEYDVRVVTPESVGAYVRAAAR